MEEALGSNENSSVKNAFRSYFLWVGCGVNQIFRLRRF